MSARTVKPGLLSLKEKAALELELFKEGCDTMEGEN